MNKVRRHRLEILALAAIALSALLACKTLAKKLKGGTAGTSTSEPFTQSYGSKNGLITAHYPVSFAAKTVASTSVELVRNLSLGHDEAVVLVPIERPITDELDELSRVMSNAQTSKLNRFTKRYEKHTTCNGQPAVEIEGVWYTKASGTAVVWHSCNFMRDGHGYSFSYLVPQSEEAAQGPYLKKILEATSFN